MKTGKVNNFTVSQGITDVLTRAENGRQLAFAGNRHRIIMGLRLSGWLLNKPPGLYFTRCEVLSKKGTVFITSQDEITEFGDIVLKTRY